MNVYISVPSAALRWRLDPELIRRRCFSGRIPGAKRVGGIWLVPATAC